jgi:hypothetical protein
MAQMKESRADYTVSRWTIGRARTLGRAALIAGLASAALFTAACGSDSSTTGPGNPPPSNTPIGNYSMTTANGKSLPVAIYADGNFTYEVTTGTIALTNDHRYSLITTYRQTIPGNVETFVDSTGGTWAQSASTISLTDGADGSTGQLTWATTTLSFAVVDGKVTNTYVYTKK